MPVDPQASGVVCDALERARKRVDGVEHVRVHSTRLGVRGVAFFLEAVPLEEAQRQCRLLCLEAVASAAEVSEWRIEA